ncbi:hypothetical protein IEN85_00705 [Pelagicoccus sp. NFK12]|uniref:Uncharacterized protein n=1 Tax=Pelagicoccus enzymogenes TaxID=2773457 RepID=A0A927F417_9BACT|nr:hypothetical protein [Pelagicoccus enzymogenes]MBD5778013.1 hypothetical protein [Pelagicoccus enzymogenes]
MKSKSPSAASKKSTPNSAPKRVDRSDPPFSPRWRGFSEDALLLRWVGRSAGDNKSSGKRPCAAILFGWTFLLAACSNVPPSSQVELTAPNLVTQSEQPAGVTHTLTLQTPTPAWKLVPMMLYRTSENEYLCVHTLSAPDGMVAQVLSTVSNQISFRHLGSSEPVVRHYVLGKTWKWNGNPEVTFIDSIDELKDALADAQSVPFTTP